MNLLHALQLFFLLSNLLYFTRIVSKLKVILNTDFAATNELVLYFVGFLSQARSLKVAIELIFHPL